MRQLLPYLKCALFLLAAVSLLASCYNKPVKEQEMAFADEEITNLATDHADKPAAAATKAKLPQWDYKRTACPTGPNIPPQNFGEIAPGQTAWRSEAGTIKNQIFAEIYQIGLTQDNAVQLALVNNPELFAYYENLEVGYADFLEAGLRENPVFKKTTRNSFEPEFRVNKEFETMTNFLDYFLIPFRQNAELADLHVIEAEFEQKVLDLIEMVQINWLLVKTMELILDQEAVHVEIKELAAGLSEEQRKAGNVSALEARTRAIEFQEAVGKWKGLNAELAAAREEMHRSLGLFGSETCFQVTGEIDWKRDFSLPPLHDLEQAAVENRQDLEAIRREIYAFAEEAKLKDPWTYAKLLVGESLEREPDGEISMGPSIELEVPIFNNGEAQRKKYHALISQAQKKLLSKAVQACSEVREFLNTTAIYRSQLEDLELRVLPDWKTQVAEAMTHYNVMTLGVFELFDLKEREIDATIAHINALKHYLKAKIKLLHAIGGSSVIVGGKV